MKNERNCAGRVDSYFLQYRLDRTEVVKSIGPKLVPFLKAVCVYFVAWLPESEKPTVFAAILKILPILCLCGFVGLQGISLEKEHNYSRHILLGLIFSGIGDVCLVWKNMYFIHGMIAFGIAHILYIRAFGFQPFQLRNLPLLLFCFFPGLFVYYICYPGLQGKLVIAVLIYGIVITGMLWRAITCVQNQIEENGLCRWTRMSACFGAVMFYISDNIIALNKFCFPIPWSRALIMTTYYAGQMGIAVSAFNIEEEYNLRMKSNKKCK